MMESQRPQATALSRKKEPRNEYLTRMRAETESKLLTALTKTELTLIDAIPRALNVGTRLTFRCKCGVEGPRRLSDIIIGGVNSCRRCANIDRNGSASLAPYTAANKYATDYERMLMSTLAGARGRCENPHKRGYKNYGGRGIEFRFSTLREGVAYLLKALPKKQEGESLDRVNNDGHYEEGNLRWADRTSQRLNQRPHFRGNRHTKRIDELHRCRRECSRETIRRWVHQGWSDDKILTHKKGSHAK